MKLNIKAFSLACGIFAGVFVFIIMLLSLATGFMEIPVKLIGSLHPWFSYTLLGALWMGVLHFICAFIAGWLFVWVYNKLTK